MIPPNHRTERTWNSIPWIVEYLDLMMFHMVKNLLAMQETGFSPCVWKIPWRRKWLPTPTFLSGDLHGQRSLSSVQSLSRVRLFATPSWTVACQASLSIASTWSLLKLMSIESVMPSKHLILCRPLLLLTSIFPGIRVFSNESVLRIRWPKYWSVSFSMSPSNEHSGLISFKMNWLDLFAVKGTLRSLLQHHSSKASILRHSAFFIVQLLDRLSLEK